MSGVLHGITAAMQPDPYWQSTSLLLRMEGVNNATTIIDASRAARTVTVNGNAKLTTSTKKYGDAALALDGSGDYLTVGSDAAFNFGSSTDFTIEFWIYPNSLPYAKIVSAVSSGGLLLYYLDGIGIGYGREQVALEYNSNATLTLSTWTHVAYCRSGSSFRIFRNGTQVGTTQTTTQSYNFTGGFTIGASVTDINQAVNGFIDNFRVTSGVARYTANFTPPGPL